MKQGSIFFPAPADPSRWESQRRELAAKYLAGRPEGRRPRRGPARLLIILLCMFVAGFFFENTVPVPDNAWVYVDSRLGVYYAPTYLQDSGRDAAGLLQTTVREARKMRCAPDPTAKSLGYFQQPDRSMSGGFLQRLGLLPPLPSRWNRDGTWNW